MSAPDIPEIRALLVRWNSARLRGANEAKDRYGSDITRQVPALLAEVERLERDCDDWMKIAAAAESAGTRAEIDRDALTAEVERLTAERDNAVTSLADLKRAMRAALGGAS